MSTTTPTAPACPAPPENLTQTSTSPRPKIASELRPRLQDEVGHRGPAARLAAMGRPLRLPAERHVRVRCLGCGKPGTGAGQGPDGDQAAVLCPAAGRGGIRIGA